MEVTPNGGISAPAVDLLQPADGSSFLATDTITFEAVAEDLFPALVDVTASIELESNRDGALGTGGGPISTSLSEGVHIITARGFEPDDNNPGSDSIVVIVEPAP